MNSVLWRTPGLEPTARAATRRLRLEPLEDRSVPSAFEVWSIDQSNTRDANGDGTLDSGGTLYIYEGRELNGRNASQAEPEVIDLGGDTFHNYLVAATGESGVRPHMLMFNSDRTHALLAYVASGHVVFIDTRTRQPVGVVDVDPQAHAAFPSPDGSYVIVANQNGKLLQRIFTDYENNVFTLDPVALDLTAFEGPGRPSNRPICPIVTSDSRFTFVTLGGGGMLVVHTAASAPMTVVADYTADMIHTEGCGGAELNGKMYINAGGAGHHDLYVFNLKDFDTVPNPTNGPEPKLIYSLDGPPATTSVDAHGVTLTRHGRYLWVADRWANNVVVVDTKSDRVVNEFSLVGNVSSDPAPDLMVTSPSGNRVFTSLRGPIPLTANNPAFNNAVGNTPGVGVIRVTQGGRSGKLMAVAPISHVVAGVERADPHAIAVLEVRRHHGHGAERSVHKSNRTPLGFGLSDSISFDFNFGRQSLSANFAPGSNMEFVRPDVVDEQRRTDLLSVLLHEDRNLLDYGNVAVMAGALAPGKQWPLDALDIGIDAA